MDVFVGRARELDTLRAAVDRAQDAQGGWVLLTGDAGMGKTRLVDTALSTARGARRTTVWSAARETEQHVPYRLWRPVLRLLEQDHVLSRLRGPAEGAGAADRADLHDEVTDLLVTSARSRPLVVVLEDLHWADPDSVALLDTATPALHASHVLLIATSRTAITGDHGTLRPDLHLPLLPLSAAEVEELADALDAPAEVRADLHGRTGGNPLYVRELVQASTAGTVPTTLAAGVAARLAAAGQEAVAIAEAAAALGEEAPLDQLLAVAGRSPDQVAGLARLVAARLLVPVPGVALHYRFPHALLREAVLAQLPPDRRALLAAAAADVLREAGAAPGVVAAHVVTAAAGGVAAPEAAFAALGDAAEDAERLCAWEQAVVLRGEAVAWARGDDAGAAGAVLAHADALARAGVAEQARTRHLDAAALARRARDPKTLALAALGLSGGLGGLEVPMRDSEQVRLLDEALAALPPGVLRAHVRARRSVAVTYLEPEDDRARDAELALAEAGDDDRAAVAALSALADARSGPEHADERLRVGAQMVRRGARAGSPEHEMLGLRVRLLAELERGDVPAAATTIAAHGRLAERLGQVRYRWYAPLWRGAIALMRGDVPGASTANAEAAALGARAASSNAFVLATSQKVLLLLARRDLPAVQELLAPALAEYPDMVGPRVAAAWVQVLQGEHRAAAAALERLVRVDMPELPVDSEWLPTVALLGETVVRARAAHLAAPLLEALRPCADLFVVDGIADAVVGSAGRAVGALAALVGDEALAEEAFAAALHAEELVGAALPAAETRELWGRALVDTGRDATRGWQLLRAAEAWRAAAGLGPPGAQAGLADAVVLSRADDGWEYVRGERRGELPRTRGLELLAVLLQRPDEELRAVDLDGRDVQEDDLGPALDQQAARAYRRRVAELTEQLEEARADADADRAARLRRERDQLEHALGAALGLGGRARPHGSSAERARTAVTKALRDAVRRIGDVDPLVGEHLAASVRTGSWCSYRPDPASRVTWRLTGARL